MRIRLFKANRCVFDSDQVDLMLVEDSQGNPVSLAANTDVGSSFVVATIDNEKEFNHMLRQLGIDKTVVRTSLDLKPQAKLATVVP